MRGGFGGLVALQTGGGEPRALAVIQRSCAVWVRATSLGGVEASPSTARRSKGRRARRRLI